MSFKSSLGIVLACSAFLLYAEFDAVTIRHTEKTPFSDRKKLSPEWGKTDAVSGFVIPGKYRVETVRSEGAMLFDDTNLYVLLTSTDKSGCDFIQNNLGKKGIGTVVTEENGL